MKFKSIREYIGILKQIKGASDIKEEPERVRYLSGIELPKAQTKPLEYMQRYFIPNPDFSECIGDVEKHIDRRMWLHSDINKEHLEKGFVYLTALDAYTHARVILEMGVKYESKP